MGAAPDVVEDPVKVTEPPADKEPVKTSEPPADKEPVQEAEPAVEAVKDAEPAAEAAAKEAAPAAEEAVMEAAPAVEEAVKEAEPASDEAVKEAAPAAEEAVKEVEPAAKAANPPVEIKRTLSTKRTRSMSGLLRGASKSKLEVDEPTDNLTPRRQKSLLGGLMKKKSSAKLTTAAPTAEAPVEPTAEAPVEPTAEAPVEAAELPEEADESAGPLQRRLSAETVQWLEEQGDADWGKVVTVEDREIEKAAAGVVESVMAEAVKVMEEVEAAEAAPEVEAAAEQAVLDVATAVSASAVQSGVAKVAGEAPAKPVDFATQLAACFAPLQAALEQCAPKERKAVA